MRCSILFHATGRAIVSAMSYYLGIDAGGSQTTCAIGDGRVALGRSNGAACKLSKVGEERARDVLRELIQECCKIAGMTTSDIEHTCLGVAGISGQKVTESMRSILSGVVSGEIKVVGDMVIALEAAFAGEPGVVVIAGTGSIAFGRNQRGDTA